MRAALSNGGDLRTEICSHETHAAAAPLMASARCDRFALTTSPRLDAGLIDRSDPIPVVSPNAIRSGGGRAVTFPAEASGTVATTARRAAGDGHHRCQIIGSLLRRSAALHFHRRRVSIVFHSRSIDHRRRSVTRSVAR
jgi:hypothetical protein